MLSAIPFLSPCYYGLQAYSAATGKAPSIQIDEERALHPGTPGYNSVLKKNPGSFIKDLLYPSLQKHPFLTLEKIRDDLIVFVQPNSGSVCAQGTNYFTSGAAIIYIDAEVYQTNQDACLWLANHELAHIRNNDSFKIPLVAAICSTAAATFSFSKMSIAHSALLALTVGTISSVLFTYYREGKADDEANQLATKGQLTAAKKFFEDQLQKNLRFREPGTLGKLLHSSSGEFRLDVWHPSLSSRIAKIERELLKRA